MDFNFIGTIWRPAGLSIVYLGLMLYSPMVPIPTHKTITGHTGIYLKTCICLAFLVAIAQITFHIVLLSLPPYGYFLQNCKQHSDLNLIFKFLQKFAKLLLSHVNTIPLHT